MILNKKIKSLDFVKSESTCQKRIIVCEIYDNNGLLLSRESNRCSPKDGMCHRINVIQSKINYDRQSECNWVHAEINAIKSLPENSKPYKAIIYGHDFYCDNCEWELKKIGVKELLVK